MTQPSVIITELDGALGVLPPSAGRLLAVVGPASAGPIAVPATFARVRDLVATFEGGPAVEGAAHYINAYGRPVLFVRCDTSLDGAVTAVVETNEGTSTSTVTIGSMPKPNDDYELMLLIEHPGTVATAGITYRLSYDGGRSLGPTTALGTANSIDVPGAGDVSFELGPGTLEAGATYTARTSSPGYSEADLGAALTALGASAVQWEICEIVGALTAGLIDKIELGFSGLFATGKYRSWIGHCRMPNSGETEAQYLTAMSAAFGSKATVFGSVYAGACKLSSAVTGRKSRRPASFPAAAREQSVSEEIDIADVNLGSLVGVSIRDDNGNADEHDESLNPGLDDARFAVLRTWDGLQGVYVNRPRLLCPEGSDFQLMPHRRVLNLAHAALRMYFIRRLNKPIRVNSTTGYILESEAREIESGALAAMSSMLLAKPKASGVQFVLSRYDNLLSTKTITGSGRVIPLAYPEQIQLEVGYFNPALVVQAA
jgi:hypothetical protein